MSRTDEHYADENNCFWLEANEHFAWGCLSVTVVGILVGIGLSLFVF